MTNILITTKNKLIKLACYVVVSCTALLLLGCASQSQSYSYHQLVASQPASIRSANKAVSGCVGGLILKTGESIRVVIPDHCLFYSRSANLKRFDMPVLNRVAAYLLRYKLEDIQVAAYTDNHSYWVNWNKSKILTTKQAQVVQNYLWKQGINVRLSSSEGFGRKDQVSNNSTYMGRNFNRRVEISFRYYPHQVSYL